MLKTNIGDPGYIALVSDSEGNTVGLHSPAAPAPRDRSPTMTLGQRVITLLHPRLNYGRHV